MVTRKSPGEHLEKTTAYETAFDAGKAECQAALDKASTAIQAAHAEFFKKTGSNHNDLNDGNIFFSDDLSTAFFIDFGRASKGPEVSFNFFV